MAAIVNSPGNKEIPGAPETVDLMIDKRYQPTLGENLLLGVAKAHRSIVYSHYEYRNYERGAQIEYTKGRVK